MTTGISLASADPDRLIWAQELMILLTIAVIALFFGWLLAMRFRLRMARVITGAPTGDSNLDAWAESGKRMSIDDDTVDLDPPPDKPRNPDPRWQA